MHVLLPCHPFRPREVDPGYVDEFAAAGELGFSVLLYHHEALLAGDADKSTRLCERKADAGAAPSPTLFRGWMMPDHRYASLHAALLCKGYRLLNDPQQYAEAHYLPFAYPKLEGHTPFTVWCVGNDVGRAWDLYAQIRDGDAILKDYVKSAKHRWAEACFIPAGTGEARFREMLGVFLAERGALFEKGIVLRRFVPLVSRGQDMRGHPIDREVRLFFLDGRLLIPPAPAFAPPASFIAQCQELAGRFGSRFMTVDVAETAAGPWTVIEVGDGGVSGLPSSLMAEDFYEAIRVAPSIH